METQEIKIHVDADTARLYNKATRQERRKMDLPISLKEFAKNTPSLKKIMREISEKAQAKGLTEKKLNQLLRGE